VQSSKAIVNSVVRPLGDKTPFANRQRRVVLDPTPGPAKANLPVQDENLGLWTPGHALLPSSVRKTVRGRHSSGPVFKTPETSGNHWDVMEGDDVIAPVAPETQGEEAQSEDYDEIEYMPPTAKGASAAFRRVTLYQYAMQIRHSHRTLMSLTTSLWECSCLI
jgi:hypothetical protein